MAEPPTPTSLLGPLAERLGPLAATVHLSEDPTKTMTLLKILPGLDADQERATLLAAEAQLGLRLPGACAITHAGSGSAVWLAPNEWLLVDLAITGLGKDTIPANLTFTDVSAQRTTLTLAGADAARVLAHGCSLDLHPAVFGRDVAVCTLLAQASVVLYRSPRSTAGTDKGSGGPGFTIHVRTSFARYLVSWLLDASTEYREADSSAADHMATTQYAPAQGSRA